MFLRRFSLIFFLEIVSIVSISGAALKPDLKNRFIDSCLTAFRSSSASTKPDEDTSRKICECTAEESRHQGATDSAILKEAQEFEKDSKYKIRDSHVMNAFRYCAVEVLHGDED